MQGIEGKRGLQGIQGIPGDAGAAGPNGESGIQGIPGTQGDPGAQGQQGTPGTPGTLGVKGDTGERGLPGEQGLPGDQGIQGVKGDPGTSGAKGDKGDQGIQGIQGNPGAPGPANLATCKQTELFTNSSNTVPTSIVGLAFALVSGRRYAFKFLVTFQTGATTTGIGFVFTGPAMTAAFWSAKIQQAAAGTDCFYEASAAALTTVIVSASVIALGTNYLATIEGFCQPSADGTLQLRCRSEVNLSQVTVQNTGIGFLVDAG